jgi:hypothetical protein
VPDGTLHLLLVIANPDALTPYDPESTDIPGEEHYYITSRPRTDHPWIAQVGEGPDARPDVSIGGQRLDLPLGRSVDGECQVRVIDEPAPVTGVACDVNSVLIPEGDADLHLDGTAFSSGKWAVEPNISHPITSAPSIHWNVNGNGPLLGTFGLFGWTDPGNWVRSTNILATLNGTEGGGAAWGPGEYKGLKFRVNHTLDTGGGNAFVELRGAGDPVRVSGFAGFNFWDVPENPLNNQVDTVVYAVTNASGEIDVALGGENMFPSFNLVVGFTDLEVVECDEVVVSIESERYTTASLADAAARQKQLGRPYYLKASTDGGVTFDEMIYAGFARQFTMERSLTFLLTAGDAGRGRRVSRAWTGLNPVEDFTP